METTPLADYLSIQHELQSLDGELREGSAQMVRAAEALAVLAQDVMAVADRRMDAIELRTDLGNRFVAADFARVTEIQDKLLQLVKTQRRAEEAYLRLSPQEQIGQIPRRFRSLPPVRRTANAKSRSQDDVNGSFFCSVLCRRAGAAPDVSNQFASRRFNPVRLYIRHPRSSRRGVVLLPTRRHRFGDAVTARASTDGRP